MSLFGNLGGGAGQPSTSSSATGGAAATSFGSLFGNKSTAAPSTTAGTGGTSGASNPFGGLNLAGAGTQASGSSGLGGLFSSANTQSTAAPGPTAPTSSLFGGLGSTTSQAQTNNAPKTGSLFGASTTQPQQQSTAGASMFGSTAAPPSQPQTGGGLGGSLFNAQPQASTMPQSQSQGPLNQANSTAGRSSHFDNLLERGKKRTGQDMGTNGINLDGLPQLQLGLGDIARKVRNLGQGGPSADLAQDRHAHYLLSASGVNFGHTLRDLNQFSAQAGISTTGAPTSVADTDIDSYIADLHTQSTLAMIQDGLEQTKRDFDKFVDEHVQIDWDDQRKRIYEHFGLGRQAENLAASQRISGGTTRGAFGRSTRRGRTGHVGASTTGASFGASGPPPVIGSVISPYGKSRINGNAIDESNNGLSVEGRFARDKQEKFAEKVKDLNLARLREDPTYPVLHKFSEVEAQAGVENSEHIVGAYNTLISVTGERKEAQLSNEGGPKERQFAQEYLVDNAHSNEGIRARKRILDGSRKFLERKFMKEVEDAIERNAHEAQVGGVPSTLNRIRAYIRVKLAFKELGPDVEEFQRIGNDGVELPWVIVFFCLRGGLVQEAAEYVRSKKTFFHNNDRNFQAAVAHYANDPDRRLTPELQQKINQTYAQRARIAPTNDPYRMACYKLIGRCEMTRRTLDPLKEGLDDWVWLQFNLAREGNRAEENAGEAFGLEELRTTINDIGQRHFMSGASEAGGYGVYFYLSILAGMYEPAVKFLHEHNPVSAVHFAIALAYYGLLRVSDWTTAGSETLTYTTRGLPQLNFGRMVGVFTGAFRMATAGAAAEYLVLICLNSDLPGQGQGQRTLCHEALRELVLETRAFRELLGDVNFNGETTPGLIQERLPLIKLADDNALLEDITREAAKTADDNGRTTDAVLLSHLAGDYDRVVTIINRALSEAISVDLGQEPLRLEPLRSRQAITGPQNPAANEGSSMSILTTEDPVELARRMGTVYSNNALWWDRIKAENRETLETLIELNRAKKFVESGDYTMALDIIANLQILPLDSKGALFEIRASANAFSNRSPDIARNIGNVLMWCIGCCGKHRQHLLSSAYDDPQRRNMADQLLQKAKDLMVFAGLIRYKLPPRVFELLAREGQDAGIY